MQSSGRARNCPPVLRSSQCNRGQDYADAIIDQRGRNANGNLLAGLLIVYSVVALLVIYGGS